MEQNIDSPYAEFQVHTDGHLAYKKIVMIQPLQADRLNDLNEGRAWDAKNKKPAVGADAQQEFKYVALATVKAQITKKQLECAGMEQLKKDIASRTKAEKGTE